MSKHNIEEKNIFEDFTNLYSVSKTLRFELKPYTPDNLSAEEKGKYLESFWKDYKGSDNYKKDEERHQSYPIVKELLDTCHRRYIEKRLNGYSPSDKCPSWKELYESYDKKTWKDDSKKLLDDISKCFKFEGLKKPLSPLSPNNLIDYLLQKKDGNTKKKSKKEHPKHKETPQNIEEILGSDIEGIFKEAKERLEKNGQELGGINLKEHLKRFDKFATYFDTYKTNRENMYSKEAQVTAIANRIANENFPIFCDNIGVYKSLKENCKEQLAEIEKNLRENSFLTDERLDDIFSPKYFNECLTQKGITKYNRILGGNPNDGIKGLNSIGNEYLQQNHSSNLKLSDLHMEMLYKQILSDRETISCIPVQFDNREQMLDAINTFIQEFKAQKLLDKIYSILSPLKSSDPQKIYLTKKNLGNLSKLLCGKRNELKSQEDNQHKDKQDENKIYAVASIKSDSITNVFEEYIKKISALGADCSKLSAFDSKEITEVQIKACLDKFMDLYHACELFRLDKKDTPSNRDDAFYINYDSLFEPQEEEISLSEIVSLYDKVRNFLTRRNSDKGKILLKFGIPTRANGWEDCSIVINKDSYYLILYTKDCDEEDLKKLYCKNETSWKIMKYHYQKCDLKNVPRIFINSKGDNEAPAVKKYGLPIEKIRDRYKEYKENTEIYLQKDPDFQRDLIEYYKEGFSKHEDYEIFRESFNQWKDSGEYKNLNEFYNHTQGLCYKIEFANLDFKEALELQKKKKLFVFQIYNKDFAKESSGTPNLHTLYWKELFSERNLKDLVYKLSSQGIKFFYRKELVSSTPTHQKGSVLVNKTGPDGTPIPPEDYEAIFKHYNGEKVKLTKEQEEWLPCIQTKKAKFDLTKDKRFSECKFFLHVPIEINFTAQSLKNIDAFNKYTLEKLHSYINDINIIGIDRGENNLVYVTVINQRGEILLSKHYNIIETATYNGKPHKFNYLEKLKQVAKNRNEARKNWSKIENIKELKKGYLSQVVHEISKLVIEYKAIIVIENLDKKFRSHIDLKTYRNFEVALIQKLNFLVFKKGSFPNDNPESVFCDNLSNGLQLTAAPDKDEKNKNMGKNKQNGWMFYVDPWCTSQIDPVTGFVNPFDKNSGIYYTSPDKSKEFFNNFESIRYNKEENWFEFKFDYTKFTQKANGSRTDWPLCTYGDRINTFRSKQGKWENEKINLTDEIKKHLKKYGIDLNAENLKDLICKQSDKDFFVEMHKLLGLTLQMRNRDKDNDYIISPVSDENGNFYDSRNYLEKDKPELPKDADANGAYNIARKGLWMIMKIREHGDKANLKMKDEDWLQFAQEKPYLKD